MSGYIPLLPHILSWRAQEHFFFFLLLPVRNVHGNAFQVSQKIADCFRSTLMTCFVQQSAVNHVTCTNGASKPSDWNGAVQFARRHEQPLPSFTVVTTSNFPECHSQTLLAAWPQ